MGERGDEKGGGARGPEGAADSSLVAGRYERVASLGSGAFGEVIRAHDRLLGRDVALKRVRLEAFAEPGQLEEVRQRFVREAQVAARLRHPGIVTTHDILSDPSGSYIVMELVEGRTLQTVILEQGQLSLEDSAAILGQVAAALDDAHKQGIVHRDVKPANIMIEPSGHVKVMDFGIAKLETGANLTSSGLILGTPNYMAPEQARGGNVDARADVFSLGCILYECLSGQKPFRGDTVTAILMKILTEEAPPLSLGSLGLPPAVGEVLRRAMAKDPGRRYPSAADLVAALRAAGGLPATSVLSATVASGAAPPLDGELHLEPAPDAERTAVSAARAAGAAAPDPRARWRRAVMATALAIVAGTGVLYATGALRRALPPPPPPGETEALVRRQEVGVLGRLLGRKPSLLVTVPAASSLDLSLTTPLTSETAESGDSFEAVVRQPVLVEGIEAIPAGTRAGGHVSRAQPSGKATGRGELTLELDRLTLEDGPSLDVRAEPLLFRARSGLKKDARIAGALAGIGAVVGGLFGGKKGAATGAVAGGTAGAGVALTTKGEEVVLAPGATLSFELAEPVRLTRPSP